MNIKKERFFDYAKVIEYIKNTKNKNQREISEELECTEVHISQIANEKSSTTIEKTLKMLNDFDLCIDDFVEEKYRTKLRIKYEDKQLFGNLTDEEIILLIEFIQKYRKVKENQDIACVPDNRSITKQAGRRIRKLRLERGISEADMARALCMKPESYRNIESGVGTVMDNYVVIAKVLDIPLAVLFSDFVKNKKSIMQYELKELFGKMGMKERRKVKEFLEVMSTVQV